MQSIQYKKGAVILQQGRAELPDLCHRATRFDCMSRYLSLIGGVLVLNIS